MNNFTNQLLFGSKAKKTKQKISVADIDMDNFTNQLLFGSKARNQ
jgi:hypothetical protein